MGFYDVSCALSGLSLLGLPRSVVLILVEDGDHWAAASPPIRGIYNRLGTLDIEHADDTAWAAQLRTRIEAAPEYWEMAEEAAADHFPPNDAEAADVTLLLHLFDRFIIHAAPTEALRLDGRALGHNFISAPIYDAIAQQGDVISWARARGTPLVPLTMAGIDQHTLARTKQDLAAARERFADVPWLLLAIKQLTIEHAKR